MSMLESIQNATLFTLAQAGGASSAEGSPGFWFRTWLGEPAATVAARDTDSMFMWLWWFCVVWFIGLMALMGWFVIAYRRRPGRIAQRSASHNAPLEIAWTIIPTAFLVYIFFRGFHGYIEKVAPPGNAMELKLTGFKWSWRMEYPGGVSVDMGNSPGFQAKNAATNIPIFYIPADTPIRLRMNSQDVMHAFWVPAFRVKADLIPNRYTAMWFQAKPPGPDAKRHPMSKDDADKGIVTIEDPNPPKFMQGLEGEPYVDHIVFCAEYCGTSHSEMAAILRVVSKEAYTTWLTLMGDDPSLAPEIKGAQLYKSRCASCHSVDGSANTGPTWKNWYGYPHEYTDGATIMADDNHMVESIRYPGRHVRVGYANNMSVFSESVLSTKQVEYLIAYMKTLSDKAPATTPDQAK